jgi:TolB-like protein
LETYDVDASLKDKLKCLVFIPIISRTYCDPKSFAWEHEFKAFVEQASQDQFGLKVKLPNGNVASRVLPVRINDLDISDTKLCESILGGVFRGIDFIYKEPGVNRPLRSNEDNPHDNLNHTIYRNQINKVALAIKDIITSIAQHGQKPEGVSKEVVNVKPEKAKKLIPKTIVASVIILALIVLGYFLIPTLTKPKEQIEKSIAVLPFINDSQNDSTTYFMDGVMEEILTNLQTVKDLRVISRTSVERYRKQTKSIPEIAKELGVNYIMEGSGQKSGNKFRLRVQLIRALKESHLWAKSFEQENPEAKDYFSIQSQIAQAIAEQLEAVITTKEKKLIEKIHTANLEAYDAYLKGEFHLRKFTANDLDTAIHYFELAKEIDPEYALAYSGICDVWEYRQQDGFVSPIEAGPNATVAIMKALELDSTSAEVQCSLGSRKTWGLWDWKGGESAFKKAIALNPNHALTHAFYSHLLNILGRPEEAMEQIEIALKLDPMNPFIITFYGVDLEIIRRYDESIKAFHEALKIEPGYNFAMGNLWGTLTVSRNYTEAWELLKSINKNDTDMFQALEHGYSEGGYKGALISQARLDELRLKTQYINPTDIVNIYALAGENDKAIYWLERAYEVRDPNLPYWLDPMYDSLRNDSRFQELARKMNLPYK